MLGATRIAGRGSRVGRAFIGLLTGILTVAGVIYMFKGPTSAIFPSIMVVVISAGTFALLFLPEASKRFYAEAWRLAGGTWTRSTSSAPRTARVGSTWARLWDRAAR